MYGLYIHIPFCESKCYYCGFYSTANKNGRENYLQAVLNEAKNRTGKTQEKIDTLYIGGGTPSVFSAAEIATFLNGLSCIYNLSHLKEATIEVNPEHIAKNNDFLQILSKETPLNRISMGVQSFNDNTLTFLGRKHNAQAAINAAEKILKADIELSVDLIYGIPTSTNGIWKNDLRLLEKFGLNHFSAYSLTIEPNTVFSKKQIQLNEDITLQQYDILQQWCAANGYEQYEISSYARNGHYALHNRNYWNLSPYIGLGAGAHSYSGFTAQPHSVRRWNINNIEKYINDPANSYEQEYLTEKDTFNEYIMTALRTVWGVEKEMLTKFSPQLQEHFIKTAAPLLKKGIITNTNTKRFACTQRSILLADRIAEGFFV
jgi:oxygen-independent coproporphyrinogen-3 oxidase